MGICEGKLLTSEMMSTKCRHNTSVITPRHVDGSVFGCQVHIISSLFDDVRHSLHSPAVLTHTQTHTESHNRMLLIVHLPHCCQIVSPSPSRPPRTFPAASEYVADGTGSDTGGRAGNSPNKYRTVAFWLQ